MSRSPATPIFMSVRLLGIALALLLSTTGCEKVPDHCENYILACLGITVDSGPPGVQRLRVNVMDGIETNDATVLTPKKPPKHGLVYPLRFAIRFGEFDENLYKGMITFAVLALNDEFDVLGEITTTVPLQGRDKKYLTLSLGAPVPAADMAVTLPDMAVHPPDMSGADLSEAPDMP